MKQAVLGAIVTAAALAGGASAATAQVPGIPVYNAGVPRGIGNHGEARVPTYEAGGGTGYAGTGRAGFRLFRASAMLSTHNPRRPRDPDLSVGATLNYRVFGG